ncbi:MAG: lipoyl domain-containing protein [Candidatus Omnitrophica bacterium]|nr:lipoyl domain-containing protein [Candidatus Omnitrophota bacterium]
MKNVILPELGEGIEKALVACWHVNVGERVAGDDDLVELVTDKATFNVSADVSGIIREICVGKGQEVSIGEVLAVIEPLNL